MLCRSFYLKCDQCGRKSGSYLTRERMTPETTRNGWVSFLLGRPGQCRRARRRDFCPHCMLGRKGARWAARMAALPGVRRLG